MPDYGATDWNLCASELENLAENLGADENVQQPAHFDGDGLRVPHQNNPYALAEGQSDAHHHPTSEYQLQNPTVEPGDFQNAPSNHASSMPPTWNTQPQPVHSDRPRPRRNARRRIRFDGPVSEAVTCECHPERRFVNRAEEARYHNWYRCAQLDCPRANPSFGSQGDLDRHNREIHRIDSQGNRIRGYYCPYLDCSRNRDDFGRKANRNYHIERRHGGALPVGVSLTDLDSVEQLRPQSAEGEPSARAEAAGPSQNMELRHDHSPSSTHSPEPIAPLPDEDMGDKVLQYLHQEIRKLTRRQRRVQSEMNVINSQIRQRRAEHRSENRGQHGVLRRERPTRRRPY